MNFQYMRFLWLLFIPFFSFSQVVKFRQYREGEIFRYKLTTDTYNNDKYTGTSVAISEHRVVKEGSIWAESIKWLEKTSFTSQDTLNLSTAALSVKPYSVSLAPEGRVLLPKLSVPDMVGEITDLNTFYVAIAPALKAQALSENNREFINPELRKGNFADSMTILYGTDCIQVTQRLISTDKQYTIVETKFSPPVVPCLEPLIDTIATSIFDYPNNFQMIRKGNGDKVNLFWGVEEFIITSKIDNQNGQIVEASMDNRLKLRMRYNASPDLKTYDVEMPVTLRRNLKLELLK